jgi:uroporphyrinogen-III synthase
MDPLAGWTVAVTAERRAQEQAELLRRRGATVLLAPLVRAVRVDDRELRRATAAFVERGPDVFVATTGAGVQGWLANAWSWGCGQAVLDRLRATTVIACSATTAGALLGEGVDVAWRPRSHTMPEVLDHLLTVGVAGRPVAVQLHGGDTGWFVEALRAAGADVVEVPVYRVATPSTHSMQRLREAIGSREVDAVTFTSSSAVANLLALGGKDLVGELDRAGVVCACVGPVTAAAAAAGGLPHIVTASPHRLGSMIGLLADELGAKGREFDLAGFPVRLQGRRLAIGRRDVALTPRELTLLDAMLSSGGAVVSKASLSKLAWDTAVTEHTVEVTVNRLRRKLGPAAAALETTNRRGYRLEVA